MKKQLFTGIGALLALALAVSGVMLAFGGQDSTALNDKPWDIEITAAPASDSADAAQNAHFETEAPVSGTEAAHTPPPGGSPRYTPQQRLQQVKDRMASARATQAAIKAEHASLTSERSALLAGKSPLALSETFARKITQIDTRLAEIQFNYDLYFELEYTLEDDFLRKCDQLAMGADECLIWYDANPSLKTHPEYRQNLAKKDLAAELQERFEKGEDVETLYLNYFEQIDYINSFEFISQ